MIVQEVIREQAVQMEKERILGALKQKNCCRALEIMIEDNRIDYNKAIHQLNRICSRLGFSPCDNCQIKD